MKYGIVTINAVSKLWMLFGTPSEAEACLTACGCHRLLDGDYECPGSPQYRFRIVEVEDTQ